MLDIKILRHEPEKVQKALKARGLPVDVAEFTTIDEQRRSLIAESENLRRERNALSAQVAELKRRGGEVGERIERAAAVNARIKSLEEELALVQDRLKDWMLRLPNIPHANVPPGKDENDNPEVSRFGKPPEFPFAPKEHWELGEALGGLDFERAAKLSGSRFSLSRGWAARLERALANFFLDVHTGEHGYTEVLPPLMVNSKTMTGTGNLPKFADDLFRIADSDYWLIPTAEVPLTNIYAGEILDEDMLPLALTAQTPCFRSEAGSYGKDTRGLIRVHQFTKVEMVRIVRPEDSDAALEAMRENAENLLRRLELPYRVIALCTGDMGFAATMTYDLEVWLPGQNKYREISSCSNCGDFQARRMDLRFRPKGGGKPEFVHTLNGSGLPVGRTLAAVLENGQRADGSVELPKVLRPYLGGIETVTKSLCG
ncbi:MAG: serine--tRNA ligase [Desulfovibrio sp.]|jgi:seryl-tRNA synthetase|nr:serine--tRNA ligase [Desulfovibrio sp.]